MGRRFSKRKNLMETSQDGELIVLDPSTGLYCGLNSTGAEIWALLDRFTSASEICHCLSHAEKLELSALENVIERYLNDLEGHGLVSQIP